MLKMLMGAVIMVALVGYGILDPNTVIGWGDAMKQHIDEALSMAKEFKR
jgi:hypothetical protein